MRELRAINTRETILMAHEITRRKFVSNVAVGTTAAMALPNLAGAAKQKSDPFSFLLLGDTHFDRIEHHDLDWMREHFAKDIRQVENYCRLTKEKLPKLLQAAKRSVEKQEAKTAFCLHVGDLIEGICGNERLATRHCEEGWDYFQKASLGVPLLMTKGNHDVTGPGSEAAYRNVLMQKTAEQLGREMLARTSYTFQHGDNLFAVYDAYDRTAIDWLEQVVLDNTFRRLFVLMHLPVVPYNARSNWRVYYRDEQSKQRERLLDLLGRHSAIVLSGHLHKYSLLVRRCRTGKFVQMAVSSILKDSNAKQAKTYNAIDDYGPALTALEPKFSPDTLAVRRQILVDEKSQIEHFEYAEKSGFAMLTVQGDDVVAAIHTDMDSGVPWKRVSLSRLLA